MNTDLLKEKIREASKKFSYCHISDCDYKPYYAETDFDYDFLTKNLEVDESLIFDARCKELHELSLPELVYKQDRFSTRNLIERGLDGT